jgi:hypothetical protein
MDYGGDIRAMITSMEPPTILAPVEPAAGAGLLETERFKESVKEYANGVQSYVKTRRPLIL